MGYAVLIFIVFAIPAAFGAMVASCPSPSRDTQSLGAALEVFFGLAAFTLPICSAILHAAELGNEDKSQGGH